MQWIVPHTNWLFSFISLALLSWSTDNDYDGHSTSLYGITSRTYIYLFVWTIKIVIYRSRNFCSLQLQALSIWMNWKKKWKEKQNRRKTRARIQWTTSWAWHICAWYRYNRSPAKCTDYWCRWTCKWFAFSSNEGEKDEIGSGKASVWVGEWSEKKSLNTVQHSKWQNDA